MVVRVNDKETSTFKCVFDGKLHEEGSGLSYPEGKVLESLRRIGPTTYALLVADLHWCSSSVERHLEKLIYRGYVEQFDGPQESSSGDNTESKRSVVKEVEAVTPTKRKRRSRRVREVVEGPIEELPPNS